MREGRWWFRAGLVFVLGGSAVMCRRADPAPEATPTPAPVATPTPPPPPPPPAAPAGPRQDLIAANYTLAVALAPVAAPGASSFTFELHGTTGYHVNELYPINIEFELQNATATKTTLRREDAAQYNQEGARFALPIQTTAAGAQLRGRARFAVCSAENCVPETRTFALALP